MDPLVIRYKNTAGHRGRLLGEVTFTDGVTLAVWDPDLHEQCKELAAERVTPVRYAYRLSAKGHRYLTSITRLASYPEAYADAQLADEQRGRLSPQSYLGQKIAKGVE
jgi:hypothetical protein